MNYISRIEIDNLTKNGLQKLKSIFLNEYGNPKSTTEIVFSLWKKEINNKEELFEKMDTSFIQSVYHEVHRKSKDLSVINIDFKSDYIPIPFFQKILKEVKKNNYFNNKNEKKLDLFLVGASYEENYIPNLPLFNFVLDTKQTFFVREHKLETFFEKMGLNIFKRKEDNKLYWEHGGPSDEERILIDDFIEWSKEKDLVKYLTNFDN